ncbi:putative RND superfamily exporter [Candidatus Methanoperedens nitroreducens]|uniref:Putative RND superfamily exporter n=1 Tax=Candidatus Methanoperedens nitratireducens TaxID=1392998 RepID=A0A062VBL5_9EURY|nr:MMPL family transporter [Candidatus Methanoperedens nitroreducens]KCZ73084.1 putative RND superfamily exporter [Candidatus Methanoperedens nitroreducens]MDJ1422970.1 MMPL family transporter [Candidatus Methanoperedens sp.]
MANFLETNLKKLATMQREHTKLFAIFIILTTIVLGIGLKDLSINSDIRKEMPLELPIYKLNDRISEKFGGADTVVIAVQLDESVNSKSAVRDIRDPRVIQSLIFLDEALQGEEGITSIASPASFFRGEQVVPPEKITETLRNNPQASTFFSRDYSTTIMYVAADIGSGEEKIQSFSKLIQEQIDYTPKPPGVKFSITGQPILRMTIFDLLKRDAVFTLMVAAVLILLLLIAVQRSFIRALLIFIPLSLGLIWTMGTLGWLGIPLSIATVALSSMILGLGVEYGVFVVSRYQEERAKKFSQLDSLKTTVHGIGTAIIGSGVTTIVGFGVLSFATMPMIQHLGQTLALGIAYCLLAALLANPVMILLVEDYEHWNFSRMLLKLTARDEAHVPGGG